MSGRIEVICGSMYSGKSEALIHRLKRVEIAGFTSLIIKPLIDYRYSYSDIVSHSGLSKEAQTVIDSKEIITCFYGTEEVVAIDEAQFFDNNIVGVIKYLRDDGARVIVAGLDMDYRGEPFGPMGNILAIADKIDKLQAICHNCKSFNATMTQRLVNGEPARWQEENIMIGGFESYEARCKDCWVPPTHPLDRNQQLTLF